MTDAGTTQTAKRRPRRTRRGLVVSDVRDKTIKVQYTWSQRHPKYGKTMQRRGTLHAHDEKNEAKVGDLVEVMVCRPISKQKTWRLVRVLTPGSSEN